MQARKFIDVLVMFWTGVLISHFFAWLLEDSVDHWLILLVFSTCLYLVVKVEGLEEKFEGRQECDERSDSHNIHGGDSSTPVRRPRL